MPRDVPEWVGTTPSTPVPPRVRLRVYERDGGQCQCGCTRKILVGEKWQTDHIVALVNGGENREINLHTLLTEHHSIKTKIDLIDKAIVYKRKRKHLGIRRKSKFPGSRSSQWKKTFNHGWVRRDA